MESKERFCPYYPEPSSNVLVRIWRAFRSSGSLLNNLTDRSYRMMMGDNRAGVHRLCVVNDPVAVRRILIERAQEYPKHRYMADLLEPLLGNSLFTSNGAPWRKQRQLADRALRAAKLDLVFPLMLEAARAMLARLAKLPPGTPVAIDAQMAQVTADVIFRTIFSTPIEADAARKVFQAFETFQRLAPKATMPRYQPTWLHHPSNDHASREAATQIRVLLADMIRPRLLAHRAGQASGRSDLLESLLQSSEELDGDSLTLEELVDMVAVLFLAGHETSASALAWSLHLVAHDLSVQERMAQEALAAWVGPTPQLRDLRSLDLCKRVFRESLRLFPPIGFLVREAVASDEMRGKQIDPGATMIVSPWLIHRHRVFWERPDEFDPDRYLSEAGAESAKSAYLPFSLGPRACAGAGFALQEAHLLLALLVRHFRFEPVAGHVPRPVARLTTRSANGVNLRLLQRLPASAASCGAE